jgi:hypothetical protein
MDLIFLLVAIACILVALLAAFATLGLSSVTENIADRLIKGACNAALLSVVVAALLYPKTTLRSRRA